MSSFINNIPYPPNPNARLRLPSVFSGWLLLGIVFFSHDMAWGAETIDYTGTTPLSNPYGIYTPWPDPNGGTNNMVPNAPNSLFPSESSPSDNTIHVISGTIGGNLYGGIGDISTNPGNAVSNNAVSVTGGQIGGGAGSAAVGNVFGGLSAGLSAVKNSVEIRDATVRDAVYGARIVRGGPTNTADKNSVTIGANAIIRGNIYGAYSQASGVVTNNEVRMDGGQATAIGGIIAGGYSLAGGDISGNSVTISGGTTITDSRIYGGRLQGTITGGVIENNKVTITGGTITSSSGVNPGIYGGYCDASSGHVNNNEVSITGGDITADIYGGRASGTGGNVNQNMVELSGGTISGDIYGGRANTGQANDNNLIISGSAMVKGDDIYGGYASSAASGTATAANNSLIISGGTVLGNNANGNNIYGGYAASASGIAKATGNILTIEDGSALNLAAASLYGGGGFGAVGSDFVSGNTLNLQRANVTVAGLYNWQYLNFDLPNHVGNGDVMMTVTGTANIDGSTVNLGVDGASSPLRPGDIVTLIDAKTQLVGRPADTNVIGMQGVTLLYDFHIYTEDNQLLAAIEQPPPGAQSAIPPGGAVLKPTTSGEEETVRVNPEAKALNEGFVAGSALTSEAGDFLAAKGLALAKQEGLLPGFNLFAIIGGDSLRYKTGSRVDLDAYTVLAGLTKGTDLRAHHLTIGAFSEFGHGGYDTYNNFTNSAAVHARGDIDYVGGGVLGRLDFHGWMKGVPYVEGTARIGEVKNDFKSPDLVDAFGERAAFDSSSLYYGMHVGIGYLFDITDTIDGDFYGRYIWTHQEGDDVRLSTGEPVSFANVDSQHSRLGARISYKIKQWLIPYVGAAWEHEFDGQAKSSVYGYSIDATDLTGDTGVGEIGLMAMGGDDLSVDFGVQGYAGTREGVSGTLRLYYRF